MPRAAVPEARRPSADARSRGAIVFFAVVFAGLFGLVLWKLHRLQWDDHLVNLSAVVRPMDGVETLPGRRGTIVDLFGRPLALSVGARSCAIDPAFIRDDPDARLDDVLEALNSVLGLHDPELDRIRKEIDQGRVRVEDGVETRRPTRFVWVRRQLPAETADALERAMADARAEAARWRGEAKRLEREASRRTDRADAVRLKAEAEAARAEGRRIGAWFCGVRIEREYQRVYPQGRVAAHLVGFTDRFGGTGLEGMELFGDAFLTGLTARRPVLRDAAGRPMAGDAEEWPEEWTGKTLELSIDSVIQQIAMEALEKAVRANGDAPGLRGTAIVVDPRTGDVLAMATYPDYDPNEAARVDPAFRRNDAVATAREPGSVMKPFVYARALERGLMRFDELVDCSTYRMTNGRSTRVIKDISAFGTMSAEMGLVKSSNPCAVKIGERVGLRGLHDLVREIGFGERATAARGPDGAPGRAVLAGELRGLVRPYEKWNWYTLGSVPMGYEIAVTPLQMAMAYCVFANGGWLPEPRVLRAVRHPDGAPERIVPVRMRRRVFPEATAMTVRGVLRRVVTEGTGRYANNPVYAVAGKSGTANLPVNLKEKAAGLKGYSKTRHTCNFVGMAPFEDPRLVVSVSISESTKYGGAVSGPACAEILQRSLEYLHHPPSVPDVRKAAGRDR